MQNEIDWSTSPDTIAENSINATHRNDFNPNTDLTTFYDTTPVFSGTGETDIIYRSNRADFNDQDRNWIGYNYCDDVQSGTLYQCDQSYINFISVGRTTTWNLACHETGHAVGLMHGFNADPELNDTDPILGCMITPVRTTADGSHLLGGLNRANINDEY